MKYVTNEPQSVHSYPSIQVDDVPSRPNQHGQLDLRAARKLGCKEVAARAIVGVLNRAQSNRSAYKVQDRAANT